MNKTFSKFAFLFAAAGMLLTSGILKGNVQEILDPFVDPVQYEKPVAELYVAPTETDELIAAETDYNAIKKVIIHYYNTDKKNGNRDIYTWTTGTDEKYNPLIQDEPGDQNYWHIELDLTGDAAGYAGKSFLNFIVKTRGTWDGQSADTTLNYDEFPPNEDGIVEIWTMAGKAGAIDVYQTKKETQMAKVTEAYFLNWKSIRCVADETPTKYRLYAYDKAYLASTEAVQLRTQHLRLLKEGVPTSKTFNINFNYTAHINAQYVVETEYASHAKVQSIIVTAYKLYEDQYFKQYYNYSGNDLGCTWTPTQTTFKLWAPTAGAVVLNVYNKGTPKSVMSDGSNIKKSYFMTMQPGGVWEKTLLTPTAGDSIENKYYTYTIYNSEGSNEVVDPYAKSAGVNGKRGMILDFSKTNPDGWDSLKYKDITTPQQLSIYEIHIRDLTDDTTWKGQSKRGTFDAFAESGVTYTSNNVTVKTGFDHIKEMNVNTIQIMPVFDHDNGELEYYYKRDKEGKKTAEQVYVHRGYSGEYADELELEYNWGYNPLNYNCVEGSYSSNPEDGAARVKEFKNLIYKYGSCENNIRVTMDVVYNHVSSVTNTNFTKIMPRYYFRFNEAADAYWDGSGCSNEVKSEAPMMRKFIVDSLCWWASEYKIKGFRFDLMELIDMDTINEARRALYKIDPDIYMYGEGWKAADSGLVGHNGGGSTYNVYAKGGAASNSVHLGAFNDGGRNALKGGNDGGWGTGVRTPGWGFMSQGSGDVGDKSYQVGYMLTGGNSNNSLTQDPRQTVNYASCHDNYTLYDQFAWTLSDDGGKTAPAVANIAKAVASTEIAVAMSNGVAFMLGGDELLRTKVEYHPEKSRLDEDYVKMYNTNISHNSYKSTKETNAFRWDRKILVRGYKGDTVSMAAYWNAIANAFKARNSITKFGPTSGGTDGTTSPLCNYWNAGDGNTRVTFYMGGYVTMINGRSSSASGSWNSSGKTQVAKVGSVTAGTNTTLGMYSCAVYKA